MLEAGLDQHIDSSCINIVSGISVCFSGCGFLTAFFTTFLVGNFLIAAFLFAGFFAGFFNAGFFLAGFLPAVFLTADLSAYVVLDTALLIVPSRWYLTVLVTVFLLLSFP
jgi:hypothetical protein